MSAIDVIGSLTVMLAQDEPSGAYLFWGIVLGAAAFGIVVLELIIPSGGLLAMLAGASVVASIVAFFLYSTSAGVVALLTYMLLAPIVVTFGIKLWINSPLAKFVVLKSAVDEERIDADDEAIDEPSRVPENRAAELRQLIGAFGETVTPCRPVGTVRIEGQRVEALAETGTIPAGTPVVVTDVYDNQVKIRPR